MKGMVFTEFLDTVDEAFGEETTDRIVSKCPLSSGGVYTSVGSYDAEELGSLLGALSEETKVSPADLQNVFGKRLFGRFREQFPAFFKGKKSAFDFLVSVEEEIHIEVRKLYPDAELPELIPVVRAEEKLVLRYRSLRRLEAFCGGLIESCLAYFEEEATLTMAEGEDDRGIYHDFTIAKSGK